MKQVKGDAGRPAFTLVELLVVIAVIGVLVAVLLPALKKAKSLTRRLVCAAHERSMYMAMVSYAETWKYFHPGQNHNEWLDADGRIRKPDDPYAYWATDYVDYGITMDLFKCPAKRKNARDHLAATDIKKRSIDYSDYGLNGFICREPPAMKYGRVTTTGANARTFTSFRVPGRTIVLHDHYESTMDFSPAQGGDAYFIIPGCTFNGQEMNLIQFRRDELAYSHEVGALRECWRHDGYSNILWLDGHSSPLQETTGEDVPYEWYTGGTIY